MSCGKAHEVDCASVLASVYLYLDAEIDAGDCETVRRHLDECGPCLRQYGLEQAVKALVSRSCTESAPDALRAKVLGRINQVHLEIRQTPTLFE